MDNFVVLYRPTMDCGICGQCLEGGIEIMNKPVGAAGCYHRGGKVVGTVADKWAARVSAAVAYELSSVRDRAGAT